VTPELALVVAGTALVALVLGALALLRGWQGWLELRQQELLSGPRRSRPNGELADLKQRVRKLEAIASGE
jgi:hypothetical protein